MRTINFGIIAIVIAICAACFAPQKNTLTDQRTTDFNFGWRFSLGDDPQAFKADYNDTLWQEVNLPHDWSVAHAFDSVKGEGATGYLQGGIGWYRKTFEISLDKNQITYLYFDGIYNRSEVWVDGNKVGFHPYGYSPFFYDVSRYLKNGKNTVAVKVDHSRYADSRWYTGSGIYRDVKLITTDKLHVPIWGTYVTTPEVTSEKAEIAVEVSLKNSYDQKKKATVELIITDPAGSEVVNTQQDITTSGGENAKIQFRSTIDSPTLWDVDTPELYQAIVQVKNKDKLIDTYTTSFGIRTIRFDPDSGFFANGKNQKIKGVNLHHDAGLVGAAVPDDVWRRRLQKLKDAGVNAIRIAHNPGSEAFMDLCDEMGFWVQVEFFDEWDNPKDKRYNMNESKSKDYITRGHHEFFQEWAEIDLKNTMLRDRNHPSVFQWSIGNEIEWTYPAYSHATGYFNMNWEGNYFWELPPIRPEQIKKRYEEAPKGKYRLEETAAKLANWTREMDTTRPVVANCILPSASHVTGYADVLDIVGYSYRRVLYAYGHKHYPDKVIMGTENVGQWHEWKAVMDRPFISGTFLWTGIDYMGESHNQWPRKATPSGLLDVAGFETPRYHMFKSLWNDVPHVYLTTQSLNNSIYKVDEATGMLTEKTKGGWERSLWIWHDVKDHWNYEENEEVVVEVYSNCPEVTLYLNGESLGTKKLESFEDHIYKWLVPFEKGRIEAVGKHSKSSKKSSFQTAQKPYRISLTSDREYLNADGYSVAHIVAQVVDENQVPVKHREVEIFFDVAGDVQVLGVDNGAADNVQSFQAEKIRTHKGRALLAIQSTRNASEVTVKAQSKGLLNGTLKIPVTNTINH
nr:sugar-binding domain-containing protein [Microscilla sp. PRE1]